MSALTIRLDPDQIRELAAAIVAEQRRGDDRPKTLREAAAATGWSEDTLRRRIQAGTIKKLPGKKILIAASELSKLTNPA